MDQWNAKELKAYIEKNGGSYEDCVEKSDFLARAKAIAEKVVCFPPRKFLAVGGRECK